MHISLTDNLEAMVKSKVKSGLYNNASEVIREALRMMHKQDTVEKARYAEFKREALLGYEQAQHGEFSSRTPEEIAESVEKRHGIST